MNLLSLAVNLRGPLLSHFRPFYPRLQAPPRCHAALIPHTDTLRLAAIVPD
jgi:hypothetical protein